MSYLHLLVMSTPLLSKKAWILLSSPILLLQSGIAQFVDITAHIEVSEWHSGVVSRWPTAVHCVVGTNSWLIDGDFARNAHITYWFTGSNLVEHSVVTRELSREFLERFNHPGFPAAGSPAIGSQSTRVIASVDGNPGQPVRQADSMTLAARIAWLGFCSGPFLKREGREVLPPSDLWKELISSKGFSDKTVTFEDPLGLPKTLDLYTTKGQPVVQYRVINTTNTVGWEFPLDFVVVQYRPAPLPQNPWITAGTNGWELEFIARGRVTSARPGVEPQVPANVWRSAEK